MDENHFYVISTTIQQFTLFSICYDLFLTIKKPLHNLITQKEM